VAKVAEGSDADMPRQRTRIKIAVPVYRGIANFDDLDPLKLEPCVDLRLIQPGTPLPRDAALILLPGAKATIAALKQIKSEGWDIDIAAHVRQGGAVLGICGGYQLLGRTITDPEGIEGEQGCHKGLGLLDADTVLAGKKSVRQVSGHDLQGGHKVSGYEIHLGRTSGIDTGRSWLMIEGLPEGASDATGRISGTYVHGLFEADGFRRFFLQRLGVAFREALNYRQEVDAVLNRLAAHLEAYGDVDRILAIAQGRSHTG
jgi:adenosylcobyric acid synthase